MKIMITGSQGFVGKFLKKEFRRKDVFGMDITLGMDILDYEKDRRILNIIRPNEIYHLAGRPFVKESFDKPTEFFLHNVIGTLHLLEAIRHLGLKPRILLAGSSEEYGDVISNENNTPYPKSPYAISKLTMNHLGRLYNEIYGLHIVRTRAFNHTGPGRGEMYAESAWAKQIAECEKGLRDYVEYGNLDTIRNYTDVRDMVKAYVLAIKLPSDTYNICSDQNIKMSKIMDILKSYTKGHIGFKQHSALMRPGDFSFKKPSCEKFQKLTGWKPKIKIEKTLLDLLNYWRKNV